MKMKMKTSELTGAALNWAVAKCEGTDNCWGKSRFKPHEILRGVNYSTEWAHGGPIIERVGITLVHMGDDWRDSWKARMGDGHWQGHELHGPTPLVAAMRCYVASELGDEVDVPDELIYDKGDE